MTDQELKIKSDLINDILQVCVANGVPTTGDLWLALAFRTIPELKKVAAELHIPIKN